MSPYQEPESEEKYYEPTIMERELRGQYINPENIFIKHITQRQPIEGIIDTDFLKEYSHRVMFSGKEKATAFVGKAQTVQINTCQRQNLSLMESLGLHNLLWWEVWDNIDLMVLSQGQKGNLMNALITKKQEFKDASKQERKGWLRGMIKPKEETEEGGFY